MAAEQRTFHIITEILGVILGVFLIWLSRTLRAKQWIRTALFVAGVGNLIIDAYMISTWW